MRSIAPLFPLILLVSPLSLPLSEVYAADPDAPGDFTITDTTLQSDVQGIGVNIPWHDLNNWTQDPGFEPIIARRKGKATGGGTSHIMAEGTADEPDATFYNTVTDGFFNGATVRVYRTVSGELILLRTGTVAHHYASPANGYRFNFTSSGPAVQAGDIFFLDMILDNERLASVHPDVLPNFTYSGTWLAEEQIGSTVSLFRDRSTTAPENGGHTSMRITNSLPNEGGIRQMRFGPRKYFNKYLVAGKTYRGEVWLKQDGNLPENWVRFWMDEYFDGVSHTINGVTTSWNRFTFDFTVPAYPADGTEYVQFILSFEGPGVVWADNFYVYDPEEPLMAMRPEAYQELVDFQPPVIRTWGGHVVDDLGTTLEDFTNLEVLAMRTYNPEVGEHETECPMKLPTALPLTESLGADPWLVIGPYFDESEWLGLLEYLAGPSGTTYGDKRIGQGRTVPWTDAFDNIYLEFNVEAWNPVFLWRSSPEEHGRLAEYFFSVLQSSPYYPALADKLVLMINGFGLMWSYNDFGPVARRECPSAEVITSAHYLGGWEVEVVPGGGEVSDEGFEEYMLYVPSYIHYFLDIQVDTRDTMNSQGYIHTIAGYEGGPGYTQSTSEKPVDPVVEAYAKSLAAGTATLDVFLYQDQLGIAPANYYAFAPARQYGSHTPTWAGYRPHAHWLAMEMRNQHARGDAVAATLNSSPTADVPATGDTPAQPDTPLIAVYPFRDGPRWSVFVLSRKIFGNTDITLRLPFDEIVSGTCYALTGDPQATNTDAMNITVAESSVTDFQQNYTISMPPGSVYLFVFQDTSDIWVDFAWTGRENGSEEYPFNTLAEATAIASDGVTIKIKGDTAKNWTAEGPTLDAAMRLDAVNGTVRLGASGGEGKSLDTAGSTRLAAPAKFASNDTQSFGGIPDMLRTLLSRTKQSSNGPVLPIEDRTVFEPVIPFLNKDVIGNVAAVDSELAVRLRSADAINPGSINAKVLGYDSKDIQIEWQPAQPDKLDDIWVIFRPQDAFMPGEAVTVIASATTQAGQRIGPNLAEFITASTDEPTEPVQQPHISEDIGSTSPVTDPASNATVSVGSNSAPSLLNAATAPLLIGPEKVFPRPQRVWLPLAHDMNPDDVRLYYYHTSTHQAGWYPAENVAGWLVPNSRIHVHTNGQSFIGILVNHAAIVQLAHPVE